MPNDYGTGMDLSSLLNSGVGMAAGLFGDSSKPYRAVEDSINSMLKRGTSGFQPYQKAGEQAIPMYQEWTNRQQDPYEFYQSLMSNYSQSPYAKHLMDTSLNASNNAASASGMLGSDAHARQNMDYAQEIASRDMQQFFNNLFGINNNYGTALNSQMDRGYGAAGGAANLYGNAMQSMAEAKYNQEAAKQRDTGNWLSSGLEFGKSLFGL